MRNLADVLDAQGNRAGAMALYRQVVEAGRRVLGEQHPQTREWEQAMARREPPDEARPAGEVPPG